jgi:folate-dependent tRNA-U54 methylase TrmFO/GidA
MTMKKQLFTSSRKNLNCEEMDPINENFGITEDLRITIKNKSESNKKRTQYKRVKAGTISKVHNNIKSKFVQKER